MWKIGNVSIHNQVVAAPLAGISNPVYRQKCHDESAGLVCSEMISDKALHYKNKKTEEMCRVLEGEHPVSLQLFGSDTETLAEATEYLCAYTTCDVIDFNMGCPVTKVIKAHSGSDLMRNEERAIACVKAIVEHSNRPVTVKMRAGWDPSHINAPELAKAFEEIGVSAIAIHGRTRNQMYEGKVHLEYIKAIKEAVSIPVIGNGDIRSVEDAKRMLEETKCDAIMVGRGFLGRPYFVKELICGLEGIPYVEPNFEEKIHACLDYAKQLSQYDGEKLAMKKMRGMATWFLRGLPHSAYYRNELARIQTYQQLQDILDAYLDKVHSVIMETEGE